MPRLPTLRSTPAGISQDRQRRLLSALVDAGEVGLTRIQMGKLFGGQTRAVERALKALQTKGATIAAAYPPDGSRQKRFVLTSPPKDQTWPTPEGCLAQRVAEDTLRRSGGGAWVGLDLPNILTSDSGLGPKAAQLLARFRHELVQSRFFGSPKSRKGPRFEGCVLPDREIYTT